MTKLLRILSLIAICFAFNSTFAAIDISPVEEDIIKTLYRMEKAINGSIDDFAGRSIPNFKNPKMIIEIVQKAHKLLEDLPEKSKVPTDLIVGRLHMSAFMTLLYGRGEAKPNDGIYWYLNNKGGETGYFELMELIEMGGFDEDMKRSVKSKLDRLDFKNFQIRGSIVKKEPKFITASIVEDILEAVKQSPTAPKYTDIYREVTLGSGVAIPSKTVSAKEVAEQAKLKDEKPLKHVEYHKNLPRRKSTYQEIIKTSGARDDVPVSKNFYDHSVAINNSETKKYPQYFGRDNDVNRILDILARPNKSHIILTAKLGVDKESVLQMLQDGFVKGKYQIADEYPPLVLGLDPSFLMMQSGPQSMHNKLSVLSKATKRRIVAYIDEAAITPKVNKEAFKTSLGELVHNDHTMRVNYIFSMTSADSRKFLDDESLSAKLEEIHLKELSKEDSISFIQENYVPMWKEHFKVGESKFYGLTDEAMEFAARNFKVANANTVRAKAMTELLEGVIARKQRILNDGGAGGSFEIEIYDIRDYIKEKFDEDLIPGDKRFNIAFEERWSKFQSGYFGNEGFKDEMRELLYLHFADPEKKQMTSTIVFGPPGGGKSYGAEQVSQAFFGGKPLELNGADFKKPSDVTKITGSPPGYVGSEEQRSVFTKFIKENPNGGIILIEEADYIHPDIMELFTNMITSKSFRDGLGVEYDMSKYVLWLNSNIGQEYMIPVDAKNKMNWSQYNIRLNQLTQEKMVDGTVVKRVRADKKAEMMNKFMAAIVNNGRINGSANNEVDEKVSQAAQKQNRRYSPLYALPPSQEDLRQAAIYQLISYKTKLELDYNITLDVTDETLFQIVDLDNMEFEKGYSYVAERLDAYLFNKTNFHKAEQGASIKVELLQTRAVSPVDNKNTLNLVIDGKKVSYDLGNMLPAFDNQWAKSPEIKANIKSFPDRISQAFKGDDEFVKEVQVLLKRHAIDWKSRPVISLVGTTGNGKSQFGKAMGKAIFEDDKAYKEIPTQSIEEFNSFINGQEFRNWIESRIMAGGGVIGVDELLSIQNNPEMKLYMFNKLYKFLDEGYMTIGGKEYDLRAFIPVLTGNAMQEFFEAVPNNPDGEKQVEYIIDHVKSQDFVDYFKGFGFDPPKLARMGLMHLKGPTKKEIAHQVGQYLLEDSLANILKGSGIYVDVVVDPAVVNKTVDMLSTVLLGMRDVKSKGIEKLVLNPISGIILDLPDIKKLELKLGQNDEVRWYADGKRIILTSESGSTWEYLSVAKKKGITEDNAIQFADIKPKKKELDPLMKETTRIHEVEGHWMVSYLLHGENGAQSINLIPEGWYAGYMRPKMKEKIVTHSIVTEMKDVLELEAGHRSVFVRGTYEYGGGSNGKPRDPKSGARDDLGRVDEIFQKFLSNNIFEDYSEFSKANDVHLFKDTMRMVGKYATDYVIEYGNANGVSDGINAEFTRKIQEGKQEFLNEQEIETFVEKFEQTHKLKNHDELFYESIVHGIEKYLEREDFMDEKPLKKIKLLKDLAYQLGRELGSLTKRANTVGAVYNGYKKVEAKLTQARVEALKVDSGKKPGSCNHLF